MIQQTLTANTKIFLNKIFVHSTCLFDDDGVQIQRAEKCDLCIGRSGGPSCERACPHDALTRVDLRDADALMKWLEPA